MWPSGKEHLITIIAGFNFFFPGTSFNFYFYTQHHASTISEESPFFKRLLTSFDTYYMLRLRCKWIRERMPPMPEFDREVFCAECHFYGPKNLFLITTAQTASLLCPSCGGLEIYHLSDATKKYLKQENPGKAQEK